MLAVNRRRRAVGIDVIQFAMPPHIPPFFDVNVISGAAKNDHPFYRGAVAQRVIDILFQRHDSASAVASIRGDQRDSAAVENTIANAVRAESTEND